MNSWPTHPIRFEPTEIAPDTFVLHAHVTDGAGLAIPVNTMVIRSVRPVVVDTGMARNRAEFLHDVCSLVDPDDIGWVFVTHGDSDHAGNLTALLAVAPNATMVNGAVLAESDHHLDVGDRTLSLVRPPLSDDREARAVFDPTTGVYWAADDFGTTLTSPMPHIGGLDPDLWHAGIAAFAHHTNPAIASIDERSFQNAVDIIEGLGASVIAGGHTPVIGRHHVHEAITATRCSIAIPPPDQQLLDGMHRLLED